VSAPDFDLLYPQLLSLWEACASGDTGPDERRLKALELAGALLKWEDGHGALPGIRENARAGLWWNAARTAGRRLGAVLAEADEKKKKLKADIGQWQRDLDAAEAAAETLRGETEALQAQAAALRAELDAKNAENLSLAELETRLANELREMSRIGALHASLQEEFAALARAEEGLARAGNAGLYLARFNKAAGLLPEIAGMYAVWQRDDQALADLMSSLPFRRELSEAGAALERAGQALREADDALGAVVRQQEKTDAQAENRLA
jgi:chromosome segregation ATPase